MSATNVQLSLVNLNCKQVNGKIIIAEVKDVVLKISEGNNSTNRKVTVSYKLVFTSSEAGKLYKIAINLFGEDLPGDFKEPTARPQLLYLFTFG